MIGTLGECLGAEPNVYFHGIIRVKTRLHLLHSRMVPSCWWWFVRKTPVTFFFLLANSFAVNNCSAPKNKVSPNERIICLFSEKKSVRKAMPITAFFFGEKCSKTSVDRTPLRNIPLTSKSIPEQSIFCGQCHSSYLAQCFRTHQDGPHSLQEGLRRPSIHFWPYGPPVPGS